MARFTITDLRKAIVKINGWMKDEGWPERFIEQGRNGYQAVDEYSVDANGVRIGSGINRNICCGSSRECSAEVYAEYDALYLKHDRTDCREKQMEQVSTVEMVRAIKQIMREQGVKQLVLVDDGCPGLMIHRNRADFAPGGGNAVRAFPGPFIPKE